MAQSLLQERVRTDNVGADELAWAVNRAIHMTFSSEIDNRSRGVLGKQLPQRWPVTDVDFLQDVARTVTDMGDRGQVRRIRELIDVDDERFAVIE